MPAHIKWLDGKAGEKVVQRWLLLVALAALQSAHQLGLLPWVFPQDVEGSVSLLLIKVLLPFRAKKQVQNT